MQGTSDGKPDRQPAGVHRVEAVDVLAGLDASAMTRVASICAGSGSWTRMPSTRSSALSSVDQLRAARPRWSCRAGCARSSPCPLRASPGSSSGHRRRSPGLRRPGRWRGPGRGRCAFANSATCVRDALRGSRPQRPFRRSASPSSAEIILGDDARRAASAAPGSGSGRRAARSRSRRNREACGGSAGRAAR